MKTSLAKLSFTIYKQLVFDSRSKLLFSISGGQDSQLLFYISLHFQKYLNLNIQFVYCNHFWQLMNFFSIWEIWKIHFIFETPISIILSENFLINEENARDWRKENFYRLSQFSGTSSINLGHTGTDQIETALLNIIRGSSPKGISKFSKKKLFKNDFYNLYFSEKNNLLVIKQKITTSKLKFSSTYNPKRIVPKKQVKIYLNSKKSLKEKTKLDFFNAQENNGKVVIFCSKLKFLIGKEFQYKFYLYQSEYFSIVQKPLILYYRQIVTLLISKMVLPIIPDPTNQNYNWARNKIRLKILPILRQEFNDFCDFHILNFLEINYKEQEFFDKLLQKILLQKSYSKSFKKLPLSIQRQVLQKLFHSYTKRQFTFLQIQSLCLEIE